MKELILAFISALLLAAGAAALAAPRPATWAAPGLLRDALGPDRFTLSEAGVIRDAETGLEWLEGPDEPTSWEGAQEWIGGLGGGWRTPTLAELQGIYLPDSKRKGTYGDPLCLDPVFKRNSGYSLWSVRRVSDTAWLYDFSRGYAHWLDTHFPGRFDRSVAVRRGLR